MNELHLFAGAGGGILGGQLLGHTCVCAVEIEPYCRKILLQRQRDGIFPKFPIWDDITTFDGKPWRGKIDIVAGGFPCQNISAAGRGEGITGAKSILWTHMARIISEVRPKFAFVENSPMLVCRGLERVLSDLAEMGYDAEWGIIGANETGAPHKRDRIWILAGRSDYISHTKLHGFGRWEQQPESPCETNFRTSCTIHNQSSSARQNNMEHPNVQRCEKLNTTTVSEKQEGGIINRLTTTWWDTDPGNGDKPELGRMAHGVANRSHRLRAIGNGQVPIVAATAFHILTERLLK